MDELLMKDFYKHTAISIMIFVVTIVIGYISDTYNIFTGVQLVIIASIISFLGRFILLKAFKFNRVDKDET